VKVLQIEFNELSPRLLTELMAAGRLPSFSRFYEGSEVFLTDAAAEPPELEPWVQWPSVHYGVPHAVHGLRHLGPLATAGGTCADGPALVPVGQALSDAGYRVGLLGPMNVRYGSVNGFYLPDPWNPDSAVQPPALLPYARTTGAMVRDSSRTEGIAVGAGLPAFAAFLLRNGITRATLEVAVRQLLAERRDPGVRWRRASVLDWIQYDVLRHLAARRRVDFASFFSNSTAHYQHYFWRNMEAGVFDTPPSPDDHPSYAGAVQFGYESMDRILGRVLDDYPDAVLVLCTALSQEPWTDATKQTYRPRDWEGLLRLAGCSTSRVDVRTVMAEEFVLTFPDAATATAADEAFGRLTAEQRPLMKFVQDGAVLVGGCAINEAGAAQWPVEGAPDGSATVLGELFTPIHTVRSGRHSRDGALWFRTGRHVVHDEPVGLERIAPTVLGLFDVAPPPAMTGTPLPLGARQLTSS